MDTNHIDLNDLFEGVIFGGAIGDAIGLSTEFMTYSDIQKYYPNIEYYTYDKIIQDYHRSTWEKGDWTDDTDFTIVLMKSIIEKKKFDLDDYSLKMLDYIDNGLSECDDKKGHGIGNTFSIWWGDKYSTSDPKKAGIRTFIYNPFHPMSNESNGGIMKTSILALHNHTNFDDVAKNTIDACSITHPSPVCVYSCIVLNYLIVNLINSSDRTKNYIYKLLLDAVKNTRKYIEEYITQFKKSIRDILNEKPNNDPMYDPMYDTIKEIIENNNNFNNTINEDRICKIVNSCIYVDNIEIQELQKNQGHTLKPLVCAIYALKNAVDGKSFKDIITSIVNEGGDADTNCTVAGSVLGAFFGKSQLPQDYIEGLKYHNVLKNYTSEFIGLQLERL